MWLKLMHTTSLFAYGISFSAIKEAKRISLQQGFKIFTFPLSALPTKLPWRFASVLTNNNNIQK